MPYYNPGFPPYFGGSYGQAPQPMPMQQAVQTTQQPAQMQNSGLIFVQGEGGAKSYLVAPGCSVVLMDSEAAVFYIKSADNSGMPTLRAFDYAERKAQQPPAIGQQPQVQFATREELAALEARVEALQGKRREQREAHSDEQSSV